MKSLNWHFIKPWVPRESFTWPRRPNLVNSSTGLKYLTSLGLKNIYLITAFFLCTLRGYPVRIMRFRMIVMGFGGRAWPVDNRERSPVGWSLVKTRILQGLKTMGIYAVAIEETSCLKNLMYFNLSPYPGDGSPLNTGLTVNHLNPQWIMTSLFEGNGV